MCISQRPKIRLNDNVAASIPTESTISFDGSGGYGVGIGSVESDGE
jgi:hypothetical protein